MASRFNRRTAAVLVCAALLVAGCGDGAQSDGVGNKPTIRNPDPWTEQQVMEATGLTTDDHGLSYQTASGCEVSVVMTNANAVNVYSEAGDTVVTNPDGTAGVKADGAEPQCLAELERGLAKLE